MSSTSITPTGECFCGCGETPKPGAYFLAGHDKRATSYLDGILHGGSVAARVAAHGYGPEGKRLRERALQLGLIEMCGVGTCNEAFTVGSVELRRHRATAHR